MPLLPVVRLENVEGSLRPESLADEVPCRPDLGLVPFRDAETGLPGADQIDYWLLSTQSPFKTWIFGGEWFIHPAVRVSPNLEMVTYVHDPDPVNFPGRNRDSILRLTFFWTF